MKGMKLRVPPAPLFLIPGEVMTPIAFAEVYRRFGGHGGRPGKPIADHHGEKVLRGHRT